MRFSRVGSYNNANSFHRPEANGSWVSGVGRTYMPGSQCPGVETACDALPAVAEGGQSTYGDTLIPILGIISEVDGYFNYDTRGQRAAGRHASRAVASVRTSTSSICRTAGRWVRTSR